LGGTFRWLVHRLNDLAGFNEDSFFSEFAENAAHFVIPAPKCHEEDAIPPPQRIKIKVSKPRRSAKFFRTQKPALFC
jgi:hypothetical protein